jgi:hypothetical protein
MTGASPARLLDDVEAFLSRFVAYPSEHARVAHVLWVAHTHRMDAWESTPRIAFLSPEPSSGKSRALEVTELLVPNPIHAVNTTPAYLFRKVVEGPPTILYDEIDTVFGSYAKDNEDVRAMLNAGHRKGAVAGRCVVRGKEIDTEELPSYCAVALAGLDDLPDTIMTRSIVVRMRRRAPYEPIAPFRRRQYVTEGNGLRDELARWAKTIRIDAWPEMPEGITDRNADVWEALFVIADKAGGAWPERARTAAVAFVKDAAIIQLTWGVRLLTDLRTVFGDSERMSTEAVIAALIAIEESPWGDLGKGKELNARGLARRLSKYEIRPKTIRDGNVTHKGYERDDCIDAWTRYVTDCDGVTDTTQPHGRELLRSYGPSSSEFGEKNALRVSISDTERGWTGTAASVGSIPGLSVTSVTPLQTSFDDDDEWDDER